MKKFLSLLLVVVLTASIAVAGTLAYLTDRDSKVNTFTVGNVDITLDETFTQDSELLPGVEIEKIPTIKNTGTNDAWVWATVEVPAALDDVIEITKGTDGWIWLDGEKSTDGEKVVYTVLYNKLLTKDATTSALMSSVTLSSKVDIDPNGDWHLIENGTATDLDWNTTDDESPEIIVNAYAIQDKGFDNINDAYAAYNDQWGLTSANLPTFVSNAAELAEAVAAGETELWLNAGTYQMPNAAKGKTLTINGTKDSIIEVVPAGQGEANGQLDYSLDGSTVEFNGVTIKTNSQLYAGFARLSGTYNNCVIQNTYNLGTGNSAFKNCTINITNEYLRVNGASEAIFDGCTFNTDGRAILVFQDGSSVAQTVTVKDCTFNATAAANTWNGIHVAAVSIDGTNGTYVVNLEGTNTVDSDFNGLWQIKAGEANVTVNE